MKNKNTLFLLLLITIPIMLVVGALVLLGIFFVFSQQAFEAPTTIHIGDYDEKNTNIYDNAVISYKTYQQYFPGNDQLHDVDFLNSTVIVVEFQYNPCSEKNLKFKAFITKLKEAPVIETTIEYDKKCSWCTPKYAYYAIITGKDFNASNYTIKTSSKPRYKVECPEEYEVDKPMIYLYPTKEMNINIKLLNKEKITTSYPKYIDGWNVIAKPNGDITYNDRNYYGLYWEGRKENLSIKEDGFVIKGSDTSKFLEEKLSILGLNEREINEFIVYWLPKMEHNVYNYIRFSTIEEIDSYMPLEITPVPDTIIRVNMEFTKLDKKIDVKEEVLHKVTREGYTVVEWGGSEF